MKQLQFMRLVPLMAAVLWGLVPGSAEAGGAVKIKLATLAPEGSAWHQALLRIDQRWSDASGGKVRLKVYPGGVAGDEGDMVRKMKIGQLHAAMLTGIGMGRIHRSTIALQVPMLMSSWEELDYVRGKLAPEIEKELEKEGYVVLNWGDAGWVHQFSTTPATTPEEFRRLKYYVWTGDPEAEKAWRKANFKAVPLSVTDVMSGLQTGMVEAFGTTPLHALSAQWFGLAKHMVRLNWTPLNGATLVVKKQWEKIDPALRQKLEQIAVEEGNRMREEIRGLDAKAITAMKDRGLVVVDPSPAVIEQWRKVAELAYPDIRGTVVPEKYFDAVKNLAAEYRSKKGP